MSDPIHLTPPLGVPSSFDARLFELHQRVNEIRAIQIESCGRDGRNGRALQMRMDIERLGVAVADHDRKIDGLELRLGKLAPKVAALLAVGAMIGGAIVRYVLGAS